MLDFKKIISRKLQSSMSDVKLGCNGGVKISLFLDNLKIISLPASKLTVTLRKLLTDFKENYNTLVVVMWSLVYGDAVKNVYS